VITGGSIGALLCILGLCKMLATTATVGSGGSAGLLAPGLYIGCMFGGGIASILDVLFPNTIQNVGIFYALGMGAFFSAASQEPFGIMILIIELAGNIGLVLPLMATTIVAFSLVWVLSRGQLIYTTRQELNQIPLKTDTLTMFLNTSVSGYIVRDVQPFHPQQLVTDAHAAFARQSLPAIPVLENGKIVGAVTKDDLSKIPADTRPATMVSEIMTVNMPVVMSFTKIQDALDKMVETGTDWLVLLHPGDQHEYFGLFVRNQFMHRIRMADFT
jgi:CIC family chloride channel protein